MFITALAIIAVAGAYSPTEEAFLSKVSSASDAYGFFSREMAVSEPAVAPRKVEQIRPSVLQYTFDWVKRTLREPYASKLLASEWTAYPKANHVREPLTASASIAGCSVTWSDTGGTIDLVIDLGNRPAPSEPGERKAWFLDVLAKYFNLHDSPTDQIFYVPRKDMDSSTELWGGMVVRGAVHRDGWYTPLRTRWDSALEVVTDGKMILVRTVDLVDDDVNRNDKEGYPPPPAKSRFDK